MELTKIIGMLLAVAYTVATLFYLIALGTDHYQQADQNGFELYTGLFHYCLNKNPRACFYIDTDCKVDFGTDVWPIASGTFTLDKCGHYNAARAFTVLSILFSFAALVTVITYYSWVAVRKSAGARWAAFALGTLAGICGIIPMAIYVQELKIQNVADEQTEYGFSFILEGIAWCICFAIQPIWLLITRPEWNSSTA